MAFLPALFEEVLFRGALQNLLVKWWKAPLLGILFTALLFSLVHLSIYLFLSRAVLGFVLGLMYYKTKNIWVNIIAHFLNNAIVVTTMYYYAVQHKAIPLNEVDIKLDWWISIFAFGLLIALFKMLQKHSDVNVMKIHTKEQTLLVNEPFGNPLA
jgi:ABC-type tungstate transport system substrate-binding protein